MCFLRLFLCKNVSILFLVSDKNVIFVKSFNILSMKQIVKLRVKELANYQGSYYLDWWQNGKRHYEYLKLYIDLTPNASRAVKAKNKEVEEIAMNVRNQRENELMTNPYGINTDKKKTTICDYIASFKNGQAIGQHTIRHIKLCFGGDFLIAKITKEMIYDFYEYLCKNVSPKTTNMYLRKMHACLKQGAMEHLLDGSALNNFPRAPQTKKPVTYLTPEELTKLKATTIRGKESTRAFLFACFTGLRFSDVKKLTWKEVTEDNYLLFSQQKTQIDNYGNAYAYTHLPLNEQALEVLGERGGQNELIFKKLPNAMNVNRSLKTWAKKAGIDKNIHFHISRHTFGVIMLQSGVDIYTVSKLLGHDSVTTTSKYYANLTQERAVEAVAKFPKI
jgi:integrase